MAVDALAAMLVRVAVVEIGATDFNAVGWHAGESAF